MTAKPVHPPMAIFIPPLARFVAYSMFLSLAIFCSMTALFIWFWWPRLSSMELAALSSWAVILAGTSVWWIGYYFSRLVFWAELDDHFRCRTWSSEHTVPWNEIGRFILREDTSPLPGLKIISVMLTDGTRLSIWTRSAQADAALEIARTKPWASDWPGAPLGFGVALVVMSLGLIAFLMGLIAGYWLLMEHFAQGQQPFPIPMGVTSQIIAVVGGPFLGIGAIGFGVHQVLYRPIFYSPAVMRSTDVHSVAIWEKVRQWFSRPE